MKDLYPEREPWHPPVYDDEIVAAVRAVATGTANKGQQLIMWTYLMHITGASEEYADLSFRPGGEDGRRLTDFAEGKRFVGLMIRKLLRPEFTARPAEASTGNRIKDMRQRIQKRRAE